MTSNDINICCLSDGTIKVDKDGFTPVHLDLDEAKTVRNQLNKLIDKIEANRE